MTDRFLSFSAVARASITLRSVKSDLLMLIDSCKTLPFAPVRDARSEPARSTSVSLLVKLCRVFSVLMLCGAMPEYGAIVSRDKTQRTQANQTHPWILTIKRQCDLLDASFMRCEPMTLNLIPLVKISRAVFASSTSCSNRFST